MKKCVSLLVRLWVEMFMLFLLISFRHVSLLVRLWVEMPRNFPDNLRLSSASLWGCELKCTYINVICTDSVVSLLVRLWVEMQALLEGNYRAVCQPPCEAVSWNKVATSDDASIAVSLLVRLWVEMHNQYRCKSSGKLSASLWGCELKFERASSPFARFPSASLWGCELKCIAGVRLQL